MDAVRTASEAGALGTNLNQLFQRTFAVAKEVRSTTEIGAQSVAMAAAAVRLAQRIFDKVSNQRVLFIGAGEMIELCATHFAAQQPRELVVANRTAERGTRLAERFNGRAIPLSDLPTRMHEFDIIVSCTASTLPIIGLGAVERAVKARRHRPIFMVDLAVPRDIEPEVGQLEDVFLYTVDDLGAIVREGNASRQAAVAQAEAIIETRVQNFMQWLEARSIVPVIRHMHTQADVLRRAEVERAQKMLARGDDPAAVLEALSQALTNNLLPGPPHALTRANTPSSDRVSSNTRSGARPCTTPPPRRNCSRMLPCASSRKKKFARPASGWNSSAAHCRKCCCRKTRTTTATSSSKFERGRAATSPRSSPAIFCACICVMPSVIAGRSR